ncbi:MAG: OmpA family protein, partial [Blastocatellia bacterium]
ESATVNVTTKKAAAPTVKLTVDQSAIERGQNTKLHWETTNSKIVTISGVGEVSGSGEREVSPRVSTTFTATALGDGGNATASVRVTVTDPPPPPIAERPRTVAPVETPKPTTRPISDLFANVMKPIYFDLDKADIRDSEQAKLRTLAEWLNRENNRTVVFKIEGNCDPRGTSEYNLGLGDRRARAVKDFLISLGVEPSRVETVSFGSEKAVGKDEGEAGIVGGWANDRRADFVYLRGGEKP